MQKKISISLSKILIFLIIIGVLAGIFGPSLYSKLSSSSKEMLSPPASLSDSTEQEIVERRIKESAPLIVEESEEVRYRASSSQMAPVINEKKNVTPDSEASFIADESDLEADADIVEYSTPEAESSAPPLPTASSPTQPMAAPSVEQTVEKKRDTAFPSQKAIISSSTPTLEDIRAPSEPTNRENYAHFDDNFTKRVSEHPVSTFSIDVDTGSYANVRRILNQGQLPRHDAVRVEEMINYFAYDYPLPDTLEPPFRVITEIAPAPWQKENLLLHIGIKGFEIPKEKLPPANLVFLVDVSGSMRRHNKLDLLKTSLKLLSNQLTEKDKVSLVVYAGASGLVLEPTPGNQQGKIQAALARLNAGGSTNGGAGIQLAYAIAQQAFIKDGINRVLLATDGDFNVGAVNINGLKNLIEEKRNSGISLTTLGFGTGNYNDRLMEELADIGNGNYAYIDTLSEAQKVLVDEMGATLKTIAKDVKIQIEFNPKAVAEYRLIGYENRILKREDFSNDKIDAGEIGAGHTVTALYEIALIGRGKQRLETLRYKDAVPRDEEVPYSDELAFLRLRYKKPNGNTSKLLEWPILRKTVIENVENSSHRFRFSAAVAAFGQQLRGGKYLEQFSYDEILNLAQGARGKDLSGYRGEFVKLIKLANSLSR